MVELSECDSKDWSPLLRPVAELAAPPVEAVKAPQRQRHLSPDSQREVVEAYQAGSTMSQVAHIFGLHRSTVVAILERHGVTQRPRKMAKEQVEQARALYEAGHSFVEVGQRLGFNAQTIANRLRALGVRIREPHERPAGHRDTAQT